MPLPLEDAEKESSNKPKVSMVKGKMYIQLPKTFLKKDLPIAM
jgi:hypothetical protein